jgi:hypothetical protein
MDTMARRFEFWRVHQHRLARELQDEARLIAYGMRPPTLERHSDN